jgi:hypothetical protein
VLAGSDDVEWSGGDYSVVLARDVGIATCKPPDWQPAGVKAGSSTGMASPDGSRGLVVYRMYQPVPADGSDSRVAAVDRLLALRADGLPTGITAGAPLDASQQATVFGSKGGAWRLASYAGGQAKIVATYSGERSGIVLVVCLYGPPDWIASAQPDALLLSLREYGQ